MQIKELSLKIFTEIIKINKVITANVTQLNDILYSFTSICNISEVLVLLITFPRDSRTHTGGVLNRAWYILNTFKNQALKLKGILSVSLDYPQSCSCSPMSDCRSAPRSLTIYFLFSSDPSRSPRLWGSWLHRSNFAAFARIESINRGHFLRIRYDPDFDIKVPQIQKTGKPETNKPLW